MVDEISPTINKKIPVNSIFNKILPTLKIGFIGGGKMAQAIANSIVNEGSIFVNNVIASAPSDATFDFWTCLGAQFIHNNDEVITQCDVVFLALKPQQLDKMIYALKPIPDKDSKQKLVVSIMAGTELVDLRQKLHVVLKNCRLIRVIPNTAITVGHGCTLMCAEEDTPEIDRALIHKIFSAGGICEEIPESLMSAASALASSGLAFMHTIVEGLSDGAVKQGVPRKLSYKLAANTLIGAGQMLLQTGRHPGELKDEVCSPGGSTICGVHALESSGVRSALINAIEATTLKFNKLAANAKQDKTETE